MTEVLTDEDLLLRQHSLDIDNFLKDCDIPNEFPLNVSGGLLGTGNIWTTTCSSPVSNDFLPYRGLSNGYHTDSDSNQWSTYAHSVNGKGSPNKDDSFTPLSQPESDAGSDNSWKFDSMNSVDFSKASVDGAQYYAEAISQWNDMNRDGNGIYDPFRSSSVIDDLGGIQMPIPAREKSPLRRSQSANSRPTFADVAKKPSSPGSEPPPTPSLSSDGPAYGSQESLNSLLEKKVKPKVFRPAHRRHGGYHVPLPINPDSKYGLDDFEVHEAGTSRMERSFSCSDALGCTSQAATAVNSVTEEASDDDGVNGTIPTAKADCASSATASSEWFDPKRIFQNGGSRARSESVPCDTILNNNVNVSRRVQGGKSNGTRSEASYINNLHAETGSHSHRAAKQTNADRAKPAMNGLPPDVDTETESNQTTCNGGPPPHRPSLTEGSYYMSGSVRLAKMMALEALKYMLLALMFIIGLTGQVVYFVVHHTCVVVATTFKYLAVKVGLNSGATNETDFNSFTKKTEQFTYGLDENIKLPETSEEAMRRLLTCQGKDAYSILGIRSDASDEEIRRYYRRQAVLVHPDKNQQPGAEEAFKILGQAVEFIGTQEKRKVYDQKIREEKMSEDVVQQFSDLLTRFHEKMEEASNWIQCNNCGDKHRRYPTDKPVYSARKCNRCQCYHAAKEGEIWAETTFMGFKWHFYACMENRIYDVTPWISCQPNMVDKFQPNSHSVRIRMSTGGGNNPSPSRPNSSGSREADLEHLLKNLFPQQHSNSGPDAAGRQSSPTDGHPKSNGSACNRKGKRRARRR